MQGFFSIILLNVSVKCTRCKMHCELTPDTHNEAVSNAMTRNSFDKIINIYIYTYDSEKGDEGDRHTKIRSIIEEVNKLFIKYWQTAGLELPLTIIKSANRGKHEVQYCQFYSKYINIHLMERQWWSNVCFQFSWYWSNRDKIVDTEPILEF